MWGDCYGGTVERLDLRTGQTRSVSPWPEKSLDSPAGVLKYRWNWTQPLAISPHDHNTVYVGSQFVHRTTDGGESWTVISPDLTLNDHSHMGISGGLTPDNLGVEYWGTLFAIAESPLEAGMIWAGSNDGLVHVTRDGGAHWENVTASIPDLPAYGTVSNIEPSHFDAGTAYISVDYHQVDNRDPFIYKTADYGKTWKKISSDIPKSVFSYVHVVAEDPVRHGLLYAGTENALYVSFNDGAHWVPLRMDLPPAPVSWIVVQKQFNDLVLSTQGRGFYILDDIGPLQQLTPEVLDSAATLFKTRPAYRFHRVSVTRGVPDDQSTGQDPAYGASINYYLKAAPKGDVNVTILDSKGEVVRTFKGTKEVGINRVHWDLRYPPVKEMELRTTPPSYPQVWIDTRFVGKKTRPIYHWGSEHPREGALAAPGDYTVKLTVDGRSFTEGFAVIKDPRSAGSEAELEQGVALWRKIDADIDAVVEMVNRIERLRKQIEDMPDYLKGRPDAEQILKDAKELDTKSAAVEDELLQKYLAAGDSKTYPDDMKLYMKLLWLAGEVGDGAGDIAGNPDFAPTRQQTEVFGILQQRLERALALATAGIATTPKIATMIAFFTFILDLLV